MPSYTVSVQSCIKPKIQLDDYQFHWFSQKSNWFGQVKMQMFTLGHTCQSAHVIPCLKPLQAPGPSLTVATTICSEINVSSWMFFTVDIQVLVVASYCWTYCSSPFFTCSNQFSSSQFGFLVCTHSNTHIRKKDVCIFTKLILANSKSSISVAKSVYSIIPLTSIPPDFQPLRF